MSNMRCYYDILNVPRDAELTEIKRAYEKTKRLVEVAYKVLSDKQERTWYDSHMEEILQSSYKNFNDNYLDLSQYLTSSCYEGYDDDDYFYSIYGKVFQQIAREDMEDMDDKKLGSIPMFGRAESDFETVVKPFYEYWMSYSSKRNIVPEWLDWYNTKQIGGMMVVNLIKEENEELLAKAKKERNQMVYNLVAFVQERDGRIGTKGRFLKQNEKKNKLVTQANRKQHEEYENVVQHKAEWCTFGAEDEGRCKHFKLCKKDHTVMMPHRRDHHVVTFPVPNWMHKYIIGKNGTNIKKVNCFPKVKIHCHGDEITIDGPFYEVGIVRQRMHSTYICRLTDFEEIKVEPSIIGLIIGKKGKNINKIMKESHTNIYVDSKANIIHIAGMKKQVLDAKHIIESIVKRAHPANKVKYKAKVKYTLNAPIDLSTIIRYYQIKYPNLKITLHAARFTKFIVIKGPRDDVSMAEKAIKEFVFEYK